MCWRSSSRACRSPTSPSKTLRSRTSSAKCTEIYRALEPPMTASHELALRELGGLSATASKLSALMAAGVRRRFSYLGELAIRGSFLVGMLYIFAQLWRTVSDQLDARPGGYGLQQLVFYLAFAEAIVFTTPGLLEPELDRELRTGDIAYRIARPLAFPLQHLATSFGDRAVRFLFNLALGTSVAWML